MIHQRAEFLALKHDSRILGHSSHPVCGFPMMEQVRLCAVWPMENWLGSSLNQIQGWTTVRESYSSALEQGPLQSRRCFHSHELSWTAETPQHQQPIHTAKAERRMRERMSEADGGGELEEDDDESSNLSPAEKRAQDAERRAEWRKARLRSLENVSSFGTIDQHVGGLLQSLRQEEGWGLLCKMLRINL